MRRGADKDADAPAELPLLSEFLRGPGCVLTQRLLHLRLSHNSFAKRAAADDLLFRRHELFERDTGFPVELPYSALQHHAEVFTDMGLIRGESTVSGAGSPGDRKKSGFLICGIA